MWGSETPIISLTCGFATRGEDKRAPFRMSGKQAIGLRRPLPLGKKPWVRAEPWHDLSPSDSDLIHSGWAGRCPMRALERAD